MSITLYACARLRKVGDLCELARIASHGRRLDPSARRRVDPERTARNIALSSYADDPLDLVRAWEASLVERAAHPYKGAAIAAHAIIVVSPAWVDEHGDRHDPDNPANLALLREAVDWAEHAFGARSVVAARLDLDEAGAGAVDLILVPVRWRPMNGRSSKNIICVGGALEELRVEHREDTSFAALQTSWAAWAATRLDARIQRGVRKTLTAREHVHADVYRAVAEACRVDVAAEEQRLRAEMEQLAKDRARVAAELEGLKAARLAVAEQKATLKATTLGLRDAATRMSSREAAMVAQSERAASEATARAMNSVRWGVEAFARGHLIVTESEGKRQLDLAGNVSAERKAQYMTALAPGWAVGLEKLLIHLQASSDSVRPPAADALGPRR